MPWGSNYTFMVWLSAGNNETCIRAIYKPRDGEKPLRDFPHGSLYKREYSAYLISEELSWPKIPPTIIREGPYGIGSLQFYVDCDPRRTYFDMRDHHKEELIKFAVFDLLTNNGDRKAGHCMIDSASNLWSIDHGLTFHSSFKLRTVMLEYCGQPIPNNLLKDLKILATKFEKNDDIKSILGQQISDLEIDALLRRLEGIIANPIFPVLDPYRDVPWPLV